MIKNATLTLDKEFINERLRRLAPILKEKFNIKKLRTVDGEFKFLYKLGIVEVLTAIKIDSTDDAQNIRLNVRVPGLLKQITSKKAAKAIAAKLPFNNITTNGGTIIIPVTDFCAAISILLVDTHLTIKIRF